MSITYLWIKALYVMSLRRPTAACTVFTFCYKPFMWCRPDARLWHYYSAFSARGVFQTLVWHQHYYSAVSSRGVIQTLVWHQHYYSCIFLSRSPSDPRLAPVLLFCSFRSRSHSDPRLAPSNYYLYVWTHWLTCLYASCLHLLYLMSELSCEYFHSTHLACWFARCWRRWSLGWRVW